MKRKLKVSGKYLASQHKQAIKRLNGANEPPFKLIDIVKYLKMSQPLS